MCGQKIRIPRWCQAYSSQPVARFRPLPTCTRRFLAVATRDLILGLRAYRQLDKPA